MVLSTRAKKVAMLKVYNLDEYMVMLVLKIGFYTFRFTYFLDKTHPKSFSKMLIYLQKYIRIDEEDLTRQETNEKLKK